MKKLISLSSLALALLLTAPAHAADDGAQTTAPAHAVDDSARLESVLRAIEATPSREQLEASIPNATQLLIEAANDTNRDLFTRLRATSLLINFETPESRSALVALTQSAEHEIRRMAYYILGRTFGTSPQHLDNNLIATLERGTRDAHPEVRAHTVRSLRWVKHPDADQLLHNIAQTHSDTELRDLAQITLERKTPASPSK